MSPANPCLSCGACCAYFRVSFYWLEADPGAENPVPVEFTEDLPPHRLCMKGTNQKMPKCAALTGQVGAAVFCSIYQNRPSPCREFGIHYIDGQISADREDIERCNRARAVWNLPPIMIEEYLVAKAEDRDSSRLPSLPSSHFESSAASSSQ